MLKFSEMIIEVNLAARLPIYLESRQLKPGRIAALNDENPIGCQATVNELTFIASLGKRSFIGMGRSDDLASSQMNLLNKVSSEDVFFISGTYWIGKLCDLFGKFEESQVLCLGSFEMANISGTLERAKVERITVLTRLYSVSLLGTPDAPTYRL